MRVLCNKKDCPVCRQESLNVLCIKKQFEDTSDRSDFEGLMKRGLKAPDFLDYHEHGQVNTQEKLDVGIYFGAYNNDSSAIAEVRDEYNEILANKCDLCPGDTASAAVSEFATFKDLDAHMRKVHKRFFCELCLSNLKLFPYERKHYSREELALHKRNGDKDDFSFKGHPLCNFF
jgi:hypothetical protein